MWAHHTMIWRGIIGHGWQGDENHALCVMQMGRQDTEPHTHTRLGEKPTAATVSPLEDCLHGQRVLTCPDPVDSVVLYIGVKGIPCSWVSEVSNASSRS